MATDLLGQCVLGAGDVLLTGAESLNITGWAGRGQRRHKTHEDPLEHTHADAHSAHQPQQQSLPSNGRVLIKRLSCDCFSVQDQSELRSPAQKDQQEEPMHASRN